MNLLEKEILDKHIIEKLIPQKYPFVMVDKLLFFSNEKIVSGFTIRLDNLILLGFLGIVGFEIYLFSGSAVDLSAGSDLLFEICGFWK